MSSTAKVLIPNKEWLVTDHNKKIGAISKNKNGYKFYKNGESMGFKNLNEAKAQLGIVLFEDSIKKIKQELPNKNHVIYEYPCDVEPHNPIYNVRKKLPLYTKEANSKSQFCAGHYIIQLRKELIKSFCPKLITLQRNPYQGPFKTDAEAEERLKDIANL